MTPMGPALLLLIALTGHGPAPAALGVLYADEAGPVWIFTSRGLVRRREGGDFEFIPKAHWGDSGTPQTAAFDGDSVLVAADGQVHASVDGGCEFELLGGAVVNAVTPGPAGVWLALHDGALGEWGGGALADRPPVIDSRLDTLLADGDRLWGATARPEPVLAAPGGVAVPLTLPGPDEVHRVRLREVDGDRLYLSGTSFDGEHLWRSVNAGGDWEMVADGERSVHGPVQVCGGRVAVVDNELAALPGEAPDCDLSSWQDRRLTCLGQTGAVTYTCELRQLLAMPSGDPVFSLDQIKGLRPGCPRDPDTRALAELDWLELATDAALRGESPVGLGEGEGEAAAEGADDGGADDLGESGSGGGEGGCDCATVGWRVPWFARR